MKAPSMKAAATLFLFEADRLKFGSAVLLWCEVSDVVHSIAINAKNLARFRKQIDSRGGEDSAPVGMINDRDYARKQVARYEEELIQLLGGRVTKEQLYEEPPEPIVRSALSVLAALIEETKAREAAWHEVGQDRYHSEHYPRLERYQTAEKLVGGLKTALGLPGDWNGGK